MNNPMSVHDLNVGDQLVCINKKGWYKKLVWFGIIPYKAKNPNGPKFNDIVTAEAYSYVDGVPFLHFDEWPNDRWEARFFVPLPSDEQLEKELADTREPFKL